MSFATLTARAIPINLLAYIADEQTQEAALAAAGGEGLKLIKTVSQTVANRLKPSYPAIAFVDDNDAKDYSGDVIQAGYVATFEVNVVDRNPDTAVSNARIYEAAVEAMILNCPYATLTANTGATSCQIQQIESGFDAIKTDEGQKEFLQTFQVRATWLIYAPIYA